MGRRGQGDLQGAKLSDASTGIDPECFESIQFTFVPGTVDYG